MEKLLQLVLTVAGVVVAIVLLVALGQLIAIRKALEALVRQGRVLAQPARFQEAGAQVPPPAEVVPAHTPPVYRPVVASPPPTPEPVEPLRFEEVPEPVFAENATAIVSPPSSPVAQQTRSEEDVQSVLPIEAASKEALVREEVPAETAPSSTTVPAPPEEARSRMPIIIGIVVLVFAVGFLVFVVLYTK